MEQLQANNERLNSCQSKRNQQQQQQQQQQELDEDFKDCEEFNDQSAMNQAEASGRISRGSGGESAFSSASESDESGSHLDVSASSDQEHNHSSASSTSGRSSANDSNGDLTTIQTSDSNNKSAESPANQLNKICNLIPETRPINQLVDLIRVTFLESIKHKTSENLEFEEDDLAELQKSLPEPKHQEQSLAFRMITRFIHHKHLVDFKTAEHFDMKALEEIIEKLTELLVFRHQYRLTRVRPDQFCQEILQLYGIFPFGVDRNNLPVLYLRARVHRRWSADLDETFRRYVAWQVNEITKTYSGAQVAKSIGSNGIEKDGSFGICFDCLNVSYSCVDMDFLRYLVKILVNYYPTYCRYSLCVDLPWLFRSVWKLVKTWLPEEAQNTVQLITSKQLVDYISEDQIPNSIKFNDLPAIEKPASGKHKLPANFNSVRLFDELAEELKLNPSERKQFKAHAQKVFKEYEQLGAM